MEPIYEIFRHIFQYIDDGYTACSFAKSCKMCSEIANEFSPFTRLRFTDKFYLFAEITKLELEGDHCFSIEHIKNAKTFEDALMFARRYKCNMYHTFNSLITNKNVTKEFVIKNIKLMNDYHLVEVGKKLGWDFTEEYSGKNEEYFQSCKLKLKEMKEWGKYRSHQCDIAYAIDDKTISLDYNKSEHSQKEWNINSIAFMTGLKTQGPPIFHAINFLKNPNFTVHDVARMFKRSMELFHPNNPYDLNDNSTSDYERSPKRQRTRF